MPRLSELIERLENWLEPKVAPRPGTSAIKRSCPSTPLTAWWPGDNNNLLCIDAPGSGKSRGFNMSCQVVVQSLSQWREKYPGKEWENQLATFDQTLYMGCNDWTSADHISKKCGKVTISLTSSSKPQPPRMNPTHPRVWNISSPTRARVWAWWSWGLTVWWAGMMRRKKARRDDNSGGRLQINSFKLRLL